MVLIILSTQKTSMHELPRPELIAAYKEAKATKDTSTTTKKKAANISENQRRGEG